MSRYFNGSSAYLSLADHAAISLGDDVDNSGSFTIAGWLRAEGMSDINPHYILDWGDSAPQLGIYLYGDSSTAAGQIGVRLQSSQDVWYRPTDYTDWGDGNWRHFTLTGDGTTLRMYHDATANATTASMATLDTIDRSDAFYVGRQSDGMAVNYFQGYLAEWAKWGVALSSDDIAALAHGARPLDIGPRPQWYMPMLAELDEVIAGISLTNGGTTVGEHPPAIIQASCPLALRPIQPTIAGPYRILAVALGGSATRQGRIFSTGITIGQVNEQ